MSERCLQCEAHAELHKGNWGFGEANAECPQCESHARMHSSCSGALLMLLATAAVIAVRGARN
ncbi:hypothetical protein [Streptomyces atriruber]|uniref:hypothetical protein n=1 Tax=Streptomyces atriruber TaxID=545121 RepID=UPI0006E1A038|nr:hypothetical protein [Streptomyces atriruber]